MKNLFISALAIIALMTLSACSTDSPSRQGAVRADENIVDRPDNGPSTGDPHSVLNH